MWQTFEGYREEASRSSISSLDLACIKSQGLKISSSRFAPERKGQFGLEVVGRRRVRESGRLCTKSSRNFCPIVIYSSSALAPIPLSQ